MLIICEYGFEFPDHDKPQYSLRELDFYANIPPEFNKSERNHRLSLRKNLKTKEYELFIKFHRTKKEIIIFSSKDLQETLNQANYKWNYYHSSWSKQIRECDKVCEHEPPVIDSACSIFQKKIKELHFKDGKC